MKPNPIPTKPARPGHASTLATAVAKPGALSPASYSFLQNYVHAESGLVIDADKQYLLEARLQPLLRDHKIASLDELSQRLAARSSPSLSKLVIEAMTTNETHFFRDPLMFKALSQHVLPKLFARAKNGKIRIWSAAASSGQEAYTVAMLLLEMGKNSVDFEIVGTDISSQVLDQARDGRYVQFEVGRGLTAPLLAKYFSRSGSAWQIHSEVRRLVRFQQLDLRRNLHGLGRFDLVLCRNVLIYFDTETKKQIVESIQTVLAPGAVLVLGCAETIINIHEGFHRNIIGQSAFYSLEAIS